MAIEVTERLISVQVIYQASGDADPMIQWVSHTTVDDPDDDRLPMTTSKSEQVNRYYPVSTENEDGTVTNSEAATDISGFPQKVQDIAAVVWS